MASKFIPPPDQINSISPKHSKKSFSDLSGQSIFHETKKLIKESFQTDAFANVGALNAVVLEVRQISVIQMLWKHPLMFYMWSEKGIVPDFYEVRYRVPEIHAHLPEPENQTDYKAINRHPIALMKKEKGVVQPGDIVVLDFQDKMNFKGAVVMETVNSNVGPAGAGACNLTNTHGSGQNSLNTAAPSGDTQQQEKTEYSAPNDPPQEAFDEGIDYSEFRTAVEVNEPDANGEPPPVVKQTKAGIYIINIDEFNKNQEFKNIRSVINSLKAKNILNVCFTAAYNNRKIEDVDRLRKLIKHLKKSNFSVGLMFKAERKYKHLFKENFIHTVDVAKFAKIDYIMYQFDNGDNYSKSHLFANLREILGIKAYAIITDDVFEQGEYLGDERSISTDNSNLSEIEDDFDCIYATDNFYDYNNAAYVDDNGNDRVTQYAMNENEVSNLKRAYYLGGINITRNEQDMCLYGVRTQKILFGEDINLTDGEYHKYDSITDLTEDLVVHFGYEFVPQNLEGIAAKLGTINIEEEKQNLLNSANSIETPTKNNVTNIVGTGGNQTIEEPSFNSEPTGSQDVKPTDPPATAPAQPGMQCAPMPGGSMAQGGTNAGAAGSGAPVEPPSYRFDSIENYQNLGWTASAHHIINDVIFEYMQRFSAAVYRRLPINSPSFTGSNPKKIRLTSTARTAAKQVELMWDKIRQGGDNAVWNLYGRSEWVQKVVTGYHNNDSQTPINRIQQRIDAGQVTGHLSGKGVDVHTWSHLDAEGIRSSGASVATMRSSKFVKAVEEAARECGSKPVVESYQQHVHITIF